MQIASIINHRSSGEFKIAQESKYAGEDYWEWSVWIDASEGDLDKIDYVVYNLHFSFPDPVKTIKTRQNHFRLNASGWGTFTIYARINFKDGTVLDREHELELFYPDGTMTQA